MPGSPDAPVSPAPTADSPDSQVPPSGEPGFVDRRDRPTPMLSWYSFIGGRRGGDRFRGIEHYVDRYSYHSVALLLVFFGLTVFDAVATVYYIDHANGTEANPIAQWMLDQGRVMFVFAKGVPTMAMLLFVMIHKNFRYGRMALAVGFTFYLLLTGYHLFLQVEAYRRVLPV